MRSIASRLRRLEKVAAPVRFPALKVRFEGPGSEKLQQLNEGETDEDTHVMVVRFVAAKYRRPVEPSPYRQVNTDYPKDSPLSTALFFDPRCYSYRFKDGHQMSELSKHISERSRASLFRLPPQTLP